MVTFLCNGQYLEAFNGNTGRFSGNGTPAGGLDAQYVWNTFGTRGGSGGGNKVKVAVVELGANFAYVEMSAATFLGGNASNVASDNEHGTAVASIITGRNDGVGIVGFATSAAFYVTYDGADGGDAISNALMRAYNTVGAGGIISVSQQVTDPTGSYVPITYNYSVYNTVNSIIQNNCAVYMAAGNTGIKLDDHDPSFHPFTQPGLVPGTVYVGAGAPPGVQGQPALSRLQFTSTTGSNYGSYVIMQGWGAFVEAASTENNAQLTGGAYFNNAEGDNYAYTENFAGTSAATPIVAGSAVLLQAANLKMAGALLTPNQLKQKLKKTANLQVNGMHPTTEKIGKQPNLATATYYLLSQSAQAAYVPQPDSSTEPTTPANQYPPNRPTGTEPYEP